MICWAVALPRTPLYLTRYNLLDLDYSQIQLQPSQVMASQSKLDIAAVFFHGKTTGTLELHCVYPTVDCHTSTLHRKL